MHKPRWIFNKSWMQTVPRQRSQGSDFRDDLFLNRGQLIGRAAFHNCSLRINGQRNRDLYPSKIDSQKSLALVLQSVGPSLRI